MVDKAPRSICRSSWRGISTWPPTMPSSETSFSREASTTMRACNPSLGRTRHGNCQTLWVSPTTASTRVPSTCYETAKDRLSLPGLVTDSFLFAIKNLYKMCAFLQTDNQGLPPLFFFVLGHYLVLCKLDGGPCGLWRGWSSIKPSKGNAGENGKKEQNAPPPWRVYSSLKANKMY